MVDEQTSREILAKMKEPQLVKEEMLIKGHWEGGLGWEGKYLVPQSDGSTECFEVIRLGNEEYVIRTKTVVTESNGTKQTIIMDYDPSSKTYVARDSKETDFIAKLKALSQTKEKGSMVPWDGVDEDGQPTGGKALKLKTYDTPIARLTLVALLVKEHIVPPPNIL